MSVCRRLRFLNEMLLEAPVPSEDLWRAGFDALAVSLYRERADLEVVHTDWRISGQGLCLLLLKSALLWRIDRQDPGFN